MTTIDLRQARVIIAGAFAHAEANGFGCGYFATSRKCPGIGGFRGRSALGSETRGGVMTGMG